MKKYPSHLILLKGEDKTEEIKKFEYEKNSPFVRVTFQNNKSFRYSASNLTVCKGVDTKSLEGKALILDGNLRMDACGVQDFGKYVRVIFTDGSYRTVFKSQVRVTEQTACRSRNGFQYLHELAEKIGLIVEGRNVLKGKYDKIRVIPRVSVLHDYLESTPVQVKENIDRTVVYPFGFNMSQKEAVENAMRSKISLIEGPPGTGKTQTILNIIANAVMNNETVAVVSNNNTATENVYEKLEKYGVSFIAAPLGKKENKEKFIDNQKIEIPNIESWHMDREEYSQLKRNLADSENELNQMLESKNKLSVLTAELDELEREYKHYTGGSDHQRTDDILQEVFLQGADAQAILQQLTEYEYCMENGVHIGFFKKLLWRFRYRIRKFAFLTWNMDTVCESFENLYYIKRIAEIQSEIDGLNKRLESYSFDEKMRQYTEDSVRIFKASLARKYHKAKHTCAYTSSDLKFKADEFAKDYPVILSTTYSLTSSLSPDYLYDYVIIDEASQVDISTGALAFSCAKKAVVVGDLKQLPNVVDSETKMKVHSIFSQYDLPEAYCYEKHSLLSSVSKVFPSAPRVLLREHYRCHPEIIGFCNKRFYNNELIIMSKASGERPLAVYRTVAGNHARGHVNERQIDVIEKEVLPSLRLSAEENIGIVTPYRRQAETLQHRIDENNENIKSDTVDKFQGQERTTMIFSTVDNEIGAFASDPNRLNVAVSRAIREFIVVTDGNGNDKTSPIHDLIGYIKYHNYEVIDSQITSIFDNLYKGYELAREKVLAKYGRSSDYDSENLMYAVIRDVLAKDDFSKYDVAVHVPLKHLISDYSKLTDEECRFAMNRNSHVDFMIFSKLDYQPVLAVEVDGYAFHVENEKQQERDILKNNILKKYEIPIERFATTGSGEKERLAAVLVSLQA